MCKISYGKCASFMCLIGVVCLVVCTGSPIDDVAMKSPEEFFTSRVLLARSVHRLRHQRQLRPRIEATVYQNDEDTPGALTKSIGTTRTQRSSSSSSSSSSSPSLTSSVNKRSFQSKRHHQRSKQCHHPPDHFSMKAFKSKIVVSGKVQGIQRSNYTVSFKLTETFKSSVDSFPVHDCLTLQFSNQSGGCERRRGGKRPPNLVKADIKQSQEYVWFLTVTDDNKCVPFYAPEPIPGKTGKRNSMFRILKKVCQPNFKVVPTRIVELSEIPKRHEQDKRLRLVCRTKGLPLSRITWRLNGAPLTSNGDDVRITYVKRRSKLVITRPRPEHYGRYKCIAEGVNGTVANKTIEVHGPPPAHPQNTLSEPVYTKTPCGEEDQGYCMGQGHCFRDFNKVLYCECDNGYIGERCDQKTPPHLAKRQLKHPDLKLNDG